MDAGTAAPSRPRRRSRRGSFEPFPLSASVPYLIRQSYRLVTRELERRIAKHDITIGTWFFLRVLWEEDGLTQAELGDRVGVMGPTTVTAMERMERMGLIERRKSTIDKRLMHVHLTEHGRALERDLVPYAREVAELTLAPLAGPERDALQGLLTRVLTHLQSLGDA